MSTDFYIRAATQDDFLEMSNILKSASPDWTAAVLATCFAHDYKQWGVFFEHSMLGFVIIKKCMNDWEIMQVVIEFNHQQRGLATRLLQYIIIEARKNKVEKIQLEVRRSNHAAIHLYHQCGFVEVGIRKNYYAGKEDALLMDYVT